MIFSNYINFSEFFILPFWCPKKKGKKTAAEEDLSTIALPKKYFSKVGGLGIAPNKTFKAAIELALENQEHLRKVFIYSQLYD